MAAGKRGGQETPPSWYGLPPFIQSWRKGQQQIVDKMLFAEKRFVGLVSPVGSGKSAMYMAVAGMGDEEAGERTVALVPTKQLQTQLMLDFEMMGMLDIRGRSNYVCALDDEYKRGTTVDVAPCSMGVFCEKKLPGGSGCEYYDRLGRAAGSKIVCTNYSYWLCIQDSERLGAFKLLVLDEAHRAPDEIANYASVETSERELREFHLDLPGNRNIGNWAVKMIDRLEFGIQQTEIRQKRQRMRRLSGALARLCRLTDNDWLYTKKEGNRSDNVFLKWELIDPSKLAERLLFRSVDRVVLSSASIRRKTLELLGVERDKVELLEQDSTFPVSRRPIYWWPIARINKNTPGDEYKRWHEGMDEFMGERLDRKGIVLSVSYDRAFQIWQHSKYRDSGHLILHEKGQQTEEVLRKFRERKEPCVLVSPAIGEGVDLAYKSCEFVVIAKVPFPDISSPIMRVRMERDDTYSAYLTWQALLQNVGRGMRAVDDQCEVLVPDAGLGWIRARHGDFGTRWFHNAIRTVKKNERVPKPPPPLPGSF